MTLGDKYADVLGLSKELGVKDGNWKEEGGKVKLWGKTEYQLDANRLWDKIKEHPGWENEVVADIKATRTDVYGYHTVKSGDTLSGIAKKLLGNANWWIPGWLDPVLPRVDVDGGDRLPVAEIASGAPDFDDAELKSALVR